MKVFHYGVVLALICLASAFGVSGVFKLTKPRIILKEEKARATAQRQVVPVRGEDITFSVLNQEAPAAERVAVAEDKSGAVLGYAALGSSQGYSSKIKMMVGMNAAAEKIVGLRIVSQQETPGLGTRIAEIKADRTLIGILTGKKSGGKADKIPHFLKQFIGRGLDEVALKQEDGRIQAISGATISSGGAVAAVRDAIRKIRKAADR